MDKLVPIVGRVYENLSSHNPVKVTKYDAIAHKVTISPVGNPKKSKVVSLEYFLETFRISG